MQDDRPEAGGSEPTGAVPPPPPPSPAGPGPGPVGGPAKGLVGRARDILMHPAQEWAVIDAERSTIGSLLPYALILAAIPPLALLLGLLLLGGVYASLAFNIFLQMAIAFYVMNVAVAFGLGFVIDVLAPSLGGTKNLVQAMKVAIYSHTALWVGGIVLLLLVSAPVLYWLWFLAGFGYGAYLIYLGLPRLMRVPADKAPAYAAAAIGIWFVLMLVARTLAGSMMGGPFGAF